MQFTNEDAANKFSTNIDMNVFYNSCSKRITILNPFQQIMYDNVLHVKCVYFKFCGSSNNRRIAKPNLVIYFNIHMAYLC